MRTFHELTTNLAGAHFDKAALRDILAACMAQSKDMQLEYQQYYRSPINSPLHTLEYLYESIQLSINRDMEEMQRDEKEKLMAQLVKGNMSGDLKLS